MSPSKELRKRFRVDCQHLITLDLELANDIVALYEHDETGATFAQGRMALLEEMLRRDAIFRCKATDEAELEARARKNVDAELKRLTQRA